MRQLSLFPDTVIEQKSSSITPVSEPKKPIHQYFHKNTKPVLGTYEVKRSTYYRVSYRDGTRTKHIHVPGGNIRSDLVNYRAQKIQAMIDRGASISKIRSLIKSYSGKKNHKI